MFRATTAVVGLVVGVVLAVVLLGDALLRSGPGQTLLLAPWVLLGLWAVYVLGFAPHVRIAADGVRLHNVLRVIDVPWPRVVDVDLRWQLEVRTDEPRTYRAFGGPLAGRPARPASRSGDGPRDAPGVRDVAVIRDAWIAADAQGNRDAVVRRSWDVPALAALAILLVWGAGAVIAVR